MNDPLERLRDLFRERDPLYRDAAGYVIETGRPSVPTLAAVILMQLELAGVLDPARPAARVAASNATGHRAPGRARFCPPPTGWQPTRPGAPGETGSTPRL
ncbi:hypothetical protein PEC18_29770 [Paucibacter sp. O1-1]|nr:hypothetical protein [Paucibacter sp. O1-1]MDA3829923.1 hypothetical protein [Paucibacter sp. O1-1]